MTLQLRWRDLAVALGILIVAFALRATVVVQRAQFDPTFVPALGIDARSDILNGRGLLAGTYPTQPYWRHPGPAYLMAAIQAVLGESLITLHLVMALLDTLTTGFLIGAGWLLTKRAVGGWIVGGLYAVYAVAVYYAALPAIAVQAQLLVAAFLFFLLWQRERLSWGRTVLLGLIAGWLVVTRLNIAPLVGVYGLWLLAQRSPWGRHIGHAALFSIVTLSVVAPFTLHNYLLSDGDFIPVATTGPYAVYLANNRDSTGLGQVTNSYETADLALVDALWRDIRIDPARYASLTLFKIARFVDYAEIGQNYDYRTTREASAVLGTLHRLPLNHTVFFSLAMIGMGALWVRERDVFWMFAGIMAWVLIGAVLLGIMSRIRFPVVGTLALCSGYALMTLYEVIAQRRSKVALLRPLVAGGLITAIWVGLALFVIYPQPKLPIKRTYLQLPADARPVDARFDAVELVGWRPLEPWLNASQGWLPEGRAYTVEVFWRLAERTENDLNFYLAAVADGQRVTGYDQQIGGVSFPARPTSGWDTETIHGEIVALRFDDAPLAQSLPITVGVWRWTDDGLIEPIPVTEPVAAPFVTLEHIAIFPETDPPLPDDIAPVDDPLTFGDALQLRGVNLPPEAAAGESITVRLWWEASARIPANWRLFVHLAPDASSPTVAQYDGLPLPELQTNNWPPHYPLMSEIRLTMPPESGEYALFIGLLDENNARIRVAAPDNRPQVGTIRVYSAP